MKQAADKRRSERTFEVGDRVYLKVRRFLQQPYTSLTVSKLSPKYFGPYLIVAKVGPMAYRLQLPKGVNQHPILHVSLLKRTKRVVVSVGQDLPSSVEEEEEIIEP